MGETGVQLKPETYMEWSVALSTEIIPSKVIISKVIPIYTRWWLAINNILQVMLVRLKQYLENCILLYRSQYHAYGIPENHSTEYAALEPMDNISNNIDNGKVPFASIFKYVQSVWHSWVKTSHP